MTDLRRLLSPRFSLRARMVLLSAALVSVVLLAGGLVLLAVVRTTLVDGVVETGQWRAAEVAAEAAHGLPPQTALSGEDVETFVQVVNHHRVLLSSANTAGLPSLDLPLQPVGGTAVYARDELPVRDTGPFRVVARGTDTPAGPATVFVAVSLDDVDETLATAATVGAVGLPLLVLVLSGAMWVVLGRTLAPVEAIRAEADTITGRRMGRRVPVPTQQDEIGRLARTVNAMLDRLERSAERQRRFVGDAAHELRSPIATLRAQLETAQHHLARGNTRSAGVDQLVPELLQETVRMQDLVDQLLVLARSDAGDGGSRRVPVDLDDAVEAAASSLAPRARVRVDLSGVRPAQVRGDPGLLEHVARNLLSNADRHAARRVVVGLGTVAGDAVLTVDDDGPGIAPDRRDEVFRRFTRLDAPRDRDHGGAGLGLAIVSDIVRAHGGSAEVTESTLGGARFVVRLPADGSASASEN